MPCSHMRTAHLIFVILVGMETACTHPPPQPPRRSPSGYSSPFSAFRAPLREGLLGLSPKVACPPQPRGKHATKDRFMTFFSESEN